MRLVAGSSMKLTSISDPVVDGLREGFDVALQSNVRAERSSYQLVGDVDDRMNCNE